MPFKSKSQQKYFHYLKSVNKLPKSIDLNEYDKSTDYSQLPEKKPKFGRIKKMFGK